MPSKEEMREFLDDQNLKHLRWQALIKDNWLKKHHPDIYKAQQDHLEQAWQKKTSELVHQAFARFSKGHVNKQ